jgi:hypothetical protein
VLIIALLLPAPAAAVSSKGCIERSPRRSAAAIHAFRKLYPCPATGLVRGACPNFQIDHRQPLCCGGADIPDNLRWLTIEQHKARHAGGIKCEVKQ